MDVSSAAAMASAVVPAGLATDQQPDLVDLLPCAVQGQERADLEVAGGDVDRGADLAPLTDVLQRLPLAGRRCRR